MAEVKKETVKAIRRPAPEDEIEVLPILKSDGKGKKEYLTGYKVNGSILSLEDFDKQYVLVDVKAAPAEA